MAALDWPGLDHPVIVTASVDGTARVWDPRDPGRELARFDGHTGEVWGVAALDWPGLDHPVIVTASVDGTARVWDPRRPRPGAGPLRRPHRRGVGGGGAGVAGPGSPGDRHRLTGWDRPGVGSASTPAGSWPASTATPAVW